MIETLIQLGKDLYDEYLDDNEVAIKDQLSDLTSLEAAVVMGVIVHNMAVGQQLDIAIENFLRRMV